MRKRHLSIAPSSVLERTRFAILLAEIVIWPVASIVCVALTAVSSGAEPKSQLEGASSATQNSAKHFVPTELPWVDLRKKALTYETVQNLVVRETLKNKTIVVVYYANGTASAKIEQGAAGFDPSDSALYKNLKEGLRKIVLSVKKPVLTDDGKRKIFPKIDRPFGGIVLADAADGADKVEVYIRGSLRWSMTSPNPQTLAKEVIDGVHTGLKAAKEEEKKDAKDLEAATKRIQELNKEIGELDRDIDGFDDLIEKLRKKREKE